MRSAACASSGSSSIVIIRRWTRTPGRSSMTRAHGASGRSRTGSGSPGSFLLLARESERLVGYAIVRVTPTGPEWTDTWVAADRMAEIETLVVAPELRGSGLGTRLLDAIDAELERQGIGEAIVGLVPGNEGARRLYERRGFRPRWLILARSERADRTD